MADNKIEPGLKLVCKIADESSSQVPLMYLCPECCDDCKHYKIRLIKLVETVHVHANKELSYHDLYNL